MKIHVFIFSIIQITVAVYRCRNGWVRYDNSCYHLVHAGETWTAAVNHCRVLRAELVELETDREYNFIVSFLEQSNMVSFVWLGATDEEVEHEWRWLNGDTIINSTNWHPTEPNGGNLENCLGLSKPPKCIYYDFNCGSRLSFICEMADKHGKRPPFRGSNLISCDPIVNPYVYYGKYLRGPLKAAWRTVNQ